MIGRVVVHTVVVGAMSVGRVPPGDYKVLRGSTGNHAVLGHILKGNLVASNAHD